MNKREMDIAKFESWEREEIEYNHYNTPKFIKNLILKIRMKNVVRKYDNGELSSYC